MCIQTNSHNQSCLSFVLVTLWVRKLNLTQIRSNISSYFILPENAGSVSRVPGTHPLGSCEEQMAATEGGEEPPFMAALWNLHTADPVWKAGNKEQDMTLQFHSCHLHWHGTWKELAINISEHTDMFSSPSLNHSVTGDQTFFLNTYFVIPLINTCRISGMGSCSLFSKMDLDISHL